MTDQFHPFEKSGCGTGPFRFLGVASIPAPSLAEQNPEAYRNALRDLPQGIGCGSCAHCGTPIMHNYICEDATGHRFVVGSECAAKIGGPALGDKVAIAAAKIVRDQRRAKADAAREARRAQWLIDNADKIKAQEEARAAALAQAERDRAAVTALWAFMLPILDGKTSSGFCADIARSIRDGHAPSGRAVQILGDIYAKTAGRAGSTAFEAAWKDFETRIGGQ
jgi:hypothetical protein